MLAAEYKDVKSTRLLLERGANVDCEDNFGHTALMRACAVGSTEVVRTLLQHQKVKRISLDAQNNMGNTAFMIAAESGHIDTLKILYEAGANINFRNNDDFSAIDLAAKNVNEDVVVALVKMKVKTVRTSQVSLFVSTLHFNSPRLLSVTFLPITSLALQLICF